MNKKILATIIATAALAYGGMAQATTLVLTAGNSGTINGGTYTQNNTVLSGTGTFGTFVKFSSNNGVVEAFNTTGTGFDNGNDAPHNKAVKVSEIGFMDIGGVSKMRFVLDINQAQNSNNRNNPQNNSLLNLDEVQIFLSRIENPSLTDADRPLNGNLVAMPGGFIVHQLDKTVDSTVTLDSALKPGSGSADMFLDIPLTAFEAAFTAGGFSTLAEKNGAFIYLYSRFGSGDNENTSGFEEWGAMRGAALIDPECDPLVRDCGGTGVPEPASLGLFAIGLIGAGSVLRRRRKQ